MRSSLRGRRRSAASVAMAVKPQLLELAEQAAWRTEPVEAVQNVVDGEVERHRSVGRAGVDRSAAEDLHEPVELRSGVGCCEHAPGRRVLAVVEGGTQGHV